MDYRATTSGPAMAMFEKREIRKEKREAKAVVRFESSSLFYFLISLFSLLAAGCATSNKSVEQAQLAAARANAAADRAEASASAAEKAAQDATLAADRVERTVREDTRAIDADIARINYLLAQQDRRRRRHRKSHQAHHTQAATRRAGTEAGATAGRAGTKAGAAPVGMPPTSVRSTDSD
jgi:hypothetical protein